MRPGQTAPECAGLTASGGMTPIGFNEAGADCPGMPLGFPFRRVYRLLRFNEAGADCPGMLLLAFEFLAAS